MKDKRIILIIVGIAVIVILIITLVIWLTLKNKSKNDTGDLKVLSNYAMISFSTNDNQTFYYLDNDHLTFYRLNLNDQKPQEIIKNTTYYIDGVRWAPDSTKALLKTQDYQGGNTVFWLNDLITQKAAKLNSTVIDATWTIDNKIAFLGQENGEYKIGKLEGERLNPKIIYNLKENRCDTLVSLNEELNFAFCLANQSDIIAYLKRIDLKDNNIKQIEGDFTTAKASPDKTKIIALKNQDDQSYWVLLDSSGNLKYQLDFDTDFYNIDKITWSHDNKFLLIAVREKNADSDLFYKINSENGKKTKIKFSSGNLQIDAENLMLSSNNKTLYFTSNDLLYSLNLE